MKLRSQSSEILLSGRLDPLAGTSLPLSIGIDGAISLTGDFSAASASIAGNLTANASTLGITQVTELTSGGAVTANDLISQTLSVGDTVIDSSVLLSGTQVDMRVSGISRLTLAASGALLLSSSAGLSGQYLVSAGPLSPPVWQTLEVSQGLTIKTVNSDYTLGVDDSFDTLIRVDSPVARVVTIPSDMVPIPVGAAVLIGWNGDGPVSIGFDPAVVVDTPDTYNIGKKYGKITAIKVAPNHWEIEGNLEPL